MMIPGPMLTVSLEEPFEGGNNVNLYASIYNASMIRADADIRRKRIYNVVKAYFKDASFPKYEPLLGFVYFFP